MPSRPSARGLTLLRAALPATLNAPETQPSSRPAGLPFQPQLDIKTLPFIPRPGVVGHTTAPQLVFSQPDTLDELRSLERIVEATSKKVMAATVALQIGSASGSGVLVSADGWILTAGHVSDDVNKAVTIVFQDGRRAKGVTYGANRGVDSGLVRITDPGPWPYARIGTSNDLQIGQWLIAVGHPGGYKVGRTPVVRLGRLTQVADDGNTLTTDNTLVGGDSGGPLFDLDGHVVGIHSRIAPSASDNMHVPVDAFVKDWDRIATGEVWGDLGGGRGPFPPLPPMAPARVPRMGIGTFELADDGLRITSIEPNSPVAKAGLQIGDVITKAEDKNVRSQLDLTTALMTKTPGQTLEILVLRNKQPVPLRIVLAAPSTQPSRPLPRPQTPPAPQP